MKILTFIVSSGYVAAYTSDEGEIARMGVPMTDGSVDAMRRAVVQTYRHLLDKVRRRDMRRAYEKIFILYTAPWTRIELHESHHERQRDFPVTAESITTLANAAYEQSLRRTVPVLGQDKIWHAMAVEPVSIKLNGYRVSNYMNRMTRRLDVTTAITLVDVQLHRQCAREALLIFHTDHVEGYAYGLMAGHYTQASMKTHSGSILIWYGAEATEYMIYDGGDLVQNSVYAEGYYALVRYVAQHIGMNDDMVRSYVDLYAQNMLDAHMVRRMDPLIRQYRDQMNASWYEVSAEARQGGSVPKNIMLAGDEAIISSLGLHHDDVVLTMSAVAHDIDTRQISEQDMIQHFIRTQSDTVIQ